MRHNGFIILLTFIFSFPLYAEIIDNGRFTTDTDTGLDWLDVTETVNMSYNDVIKEMGIGGKFEGFRYATAEEFNTFVGHYTDTIITQTKIRQVIDSTVNTEKLMAMLGPTQKKVVRAHGIDVNNEFFNQHFARMLNSVVGITVTGYGDNDYVYIGYSMIAKTQDFGTHIWYYSIANINKYVGHDQANPEAGSFLVRDTRQFRELIDNELQSLTRKPKKP